MATYRFDKPIKSYVERMEKQGRQAQEEYNKLASEIEALQNEGWQWKDSKTMSGYQDRLYSLSQKLNGYNSFLEQYGEALYGEGGKSALSSISEASKSANTIRDIVDFYSGQFQNGTNAETYSRWKATNDKKVEALSAYEKLREAGDFTEKAVYNEALTSGGIEAFKIFSDKNKELYKEINNLSEANGNAYDRISQNISDTINPANVFKTNSVVDELSSDEVALYNYIANTQGVEKAAEYIKLIEETLNYRQAQKASESWAAAPFIRLGTSFMTGLDSTLEGIGNAVNSIVNPNTSRPTSVSQLTGGLIQQDAARDSWISKYGVAIAQSIGQMLPSIAASAMTGGLAGGSSIAAIKGAADLFSRVASMGVLGTSVYGNAYNEAVQKGNTGWNAYGYGLASAGLEVVAESLFDAIPGLNSGKLISKLPKIGKTLDNIGDVLGGSSIARIAASGAQEGLEEVFSGLLSPVFESWLLGEDFEIDGGEILESFMIGALTSGVMNTPGEISKSRYYSGLTDMINSGATEATFGDIRSSAQLLGKGSTAKKLSDKMAAIEGEGKQVSRGRQKNLLRNFMEESAELTDSDAAKSIEAYKKAHGIKQSTQLTDSQLNEIINVRRTAKNAGERASVETRQKREELAQKAKAEAGLNKSAFLDKEYSVSSNGKVIKKDGTEADFSAYTAKVTVSDDGELTFTSASGDSFSTADSQVPDYIAQASHIAAAGLVPKEALGSFFKNIPSGIRGEAEVMDYYTSFSRLYEAGKKGEGMEKAVMREPSTRLSYSGKGEIYVAGAEARGIEMANRKAAIEKAKADAKISGKNAFRKGKFDAKAIKGLTLSKEQTMAVEVAKVFTEIGLNVEFYASTAENRKQTPNGFFTSEDGTLHFDINAGTNEDALGSGLFWTMAHEVTHSLKDTAPAEYDVLREYVLDTLYKTEDALDLAIIKQQEAHKKAHPKDEALDRETAIDEIVARACEDIFTHSDSLTKLLTECESQREGFAETLYKSVKAFIEKLITFFKELSPLYDSESYEAKAFRYPTASADKMKKLSELWESAFRAGMDNAGVVYEKSTSNNTLKSLRTKYSDRESIDLKLLDFYNSVMSMKDANARSKRKQYLGELSDSHAKMLSGIIKKETGKDINFSGYSIWIDGSAINHIVKRHGQNGEQDHSMANAEDVARIPWAVNSAESGMILRDKNGDIDYSDKYKNSDQTKAYQVKLSNQINNDTLYVVEAVPDSYSRIIHIVSAYKQKNGGTAQVLNMQANSSPQLTSETSLGYSTANNSISQPSEKVNTLPENSKKYFSDREYHINSDREILRNAFEDKAFIGRYYEQRQELRKYQDALQSYGKAYRNILRIEDEIRKLPRGSTPNSKVKQLKSSLDFYYDRLQRADEKLFTYEAEGLRNVVDAEIERQYGEALKAGRRQRMEVEQRQRERAKRAAEAASAVSYAKKLIKLINQPDVTKQVPTPLAESISSFLKSFDFVKTKGDGSATVASTAFNEKIQSLSKESESTLDDVISKFKDIVKANTSGDAEASYFYIDEAAIEVLESAQKEISEAVKAYGDGSRSIYEMDAEALAALKSTFRILYTVTRNATKQFASAQSVADFAESSIKDFNKKTAVSRQESVFRAQILRFIDPQGALGCLGKAGEHVLNLLKLGESRQSMLVQNWLEYCEKAFDKKAMDAWGKETHKFNLTVNDRAEGIHKEDVSITATQAMSIYCLSKDPEGRQHMVPTTVVDKSGERKRSAGGIKLRTKSGSGHNVSSQIFLTEADLKAITDSLTDEQKKAADAIQEYMSTVLADLGNMVSFKRFGVYQFTKKDYFPIRTVKHDASEIKDGTTQSMTALLNKSFTKARVPNASNCVVIEDAFDVFASHSGDMIQYASFALPLLDAVRWFNYTSADANEDGQKTEGSVQSALRAAYGKEMVEYIRDLLIAVNAPIAKKNNDRLQQHFLKVAKVALVGGKIKQVFLQHTAIWRARDYISYSSLLKATRLPWGKDGAISNYKEAAQYSTAARLKKLGYRETGLSYSLNEIMRGENEVDFSRIARASGFADASMTAVKLLQEAGLKPMEWGDVLGFGQLWTASKYEALKRNGKLTPNSREHLEAAGKIMDDVSYGTQVFDSVLSNPPALRPDNANLSTAFMAERLKSLQPLIRTFLDIHSDIKSGMGKRSAWIKHAPDLSRNIVSSIIASAVAAAVSAAFSRINDEDEELLDPMSFLKEFGEAYLDELSVFAKIPYISELRSVVQGYDASRLDLTAFDSAVNTVNKFSKAFVNGWGNYTGYGWVQLVLEPLSLMTGIPIQNLINDVIDVISILIGDEITEKPE